MSTPPRFDDDVRYRFRELIAWRRDVRRFQARPLADGLLDMLLDIACRAPSVGNSQPWRFVVVNDAARRGRVRQSFERCNTTALTAYATGRAGLYAKLKLAGLSEAPCVGYPEEEHLDPELERAGWQARLERRDLVLYR